MRRGQTKRAVGAEKKLQPEKNTTAEPAVLRPEQMESLSYIREMLPALRILAANADFKILGYLIEMAVDETEILAANMEGSIVEQQIQTN